MPDDEPQPQPKGGNNIPAHYLQRFLPSQGQEQNDDMPYELRLFMETIK